MKEESTQADRSATSGGFPDRRHTSRFPVTEDVKYTVVHSRALKTSGTGKTLNFGSGGLLFTTEERLPLGRTVELSVAWPALLGENARCSLSPPAASYARKAIAQRSRSSATNSARVAVSPPARFPQVHRQRFVPYRTLQ